MTSNYWRIYHTPELVERSDALRQECSVTSTGVSLHVDVYPHPRPQAPIVLFNHGAAGYCRLFVPLALLFHKRGYTVVLPDQRGQGLSGGRSGDYTIAECAQNIVDVAQWAKQRFQAPLYMAGGSIGGALTYYAAAAGAPANAIACLNLFDFGNGVDGLGISRLARLARSPALVRTLQIGMACLRPFQRVRIPFDWVGAFDKLMDERDADFQHKWDGDPIPPRLVSLRSLASTLNTSPAIPFEQNQTPVLVINQSRDQMVDLQVTQRNYERLGGPKQYLQIPFGHWSNRPTFWSAIARTCDKWFRAYL